MYSSNSIPNSDKFLTLERSAIAIGFTFFLASTYRTRIKYRNATKLYKKLIAVELGRGGVQKPTCQHIIIIIQSVN